MRVLARQWLRKNSLKISSDMVAESQQFPVAHFLRYL
jgi:hypothetical protein